MECIITEIFKSNKVNCFKSINEFILKSILQAQGKYGVYVTDQLIQNPNMTVLQISNRNEEDCESEK